MSRKALVAVTVFALVLGYAGALSAGSSKFNCNAGGRVFRITLGTSSVFDVTLMWTKSSPDNDLAIFDAGTDDLLGIGVGTSPRYEHVAIGGLAGFPVDVVAVKVGGPNGPCVLRWTNQITNLSGGRNARLRDVGSLDELAARDPRYARIKAKLEEYQSLKRRGR